VLTSVKGKAAPPAGVFRTGIVRRCDAHPENWPTPLTCAARDGCTVGDRVGGMIRDPIDQRDDDR
jgi:hypothetical protein